MASQNEENSYLIRVARKSDPATVLGEYWCFAPPSIGDSIKFVGKARIEFGQVVERRWVADSSGAISHELAIFVVDI